MVPRPGFDAGFIIGVLLALMGGLSLYMVGSNNVQPLAVGAVMVAVTAWFIHDARRG